MRVCFYVAAPSVIILWSSPFLRAGVRVCAVLRYDYGYMFSLIRFE